MRRSFPLVLVLALAACGGRAPAPAPAAAPAPVEPEPVAGPDDPVLLDAGEEPRHRLRYRVPAGTRREHAMEFAMSLDFAGQRIVSPPVVTTGRLEVSDVDARGNHTQHWIFDHTDVRPTPTSTPAMTDPMRTAMKQLEGMQIRTLYSERGKMLETETMGGTLGADAQQSMDDMQANMENLITAMPVEAVGVGARWKVDKETSRNGLTFQMHTEMEVLDVTATSVRFRGEVTITVPRQEMVTAQGAVPIVGTGGGRAETTIDLTTLESTIVSSIAFTLIADPDGAQPSTTTVGVDLSLQVR